MIKKAECQMDKFLKGRIIRMQGYERSQTEVSQTLNVPQCVIRGFKVREMLPDDQHQVDQE